MVICPVGSADDYGAVGAGVEVVDSALTFGARAGVGDVVGVA